MTWPSLEAESALWDAGLRRIAGLDEAGRGAWAGPVVAAAVVLPPKPNDVLRALAGVRDSKLLAPRKREALFRVVLRTCLAAGIGMASPQLVDRWGIVPATQQAMLMALHNLSISPDYLLIDAVHLPDIDIPQHSLPKGDARVLSIAAASIVAKVYRDRLMIALDHYQPGYGFAAHKGYGTPAHRAHLHRLGPCPSHRMSFAPLQQISESLIIACSHRSVESHKRSRLQ